MRKRYAYQVSSGKSIKIHNLTYDASGHILRKINETHDKHWKYLCEMAEGLKQWHPPRSPPLHHSDPPLLLHPGSARIPGPGPGSPHPHLGPAPDRH